ncbi:MAG: translation initiation factor IF-3 [Candidatus Dadabacteria bacterium]|nr:translation initiation factor IF-3 [Candidatus Dadabacteria bacterium]
MDGGNAIARRRSNFRARTPETRVNRRITANEVRLIDIEGEQLGVVSIEEALRISEEKEVDLVEVSSNASPPVCRLMDYGKFKYELKKQRSAKKQKDQTIKEIKFRPNIGAHDLEVKVNRMRGFLEAGNKARMRIFFRGREIVHPELGRELAQDVREKLSDVASVDMEPKIEGKNLIMILVPAKKQ